MYAEDTVIYSPVGRHPTKTDIERHQSDLDRLVTWCQVNRLSINAKKTKYMILVTNKHSKLRNLDPNLTLNDSKIANTHTYKYLGILLNPN